MRDGSESCRSKTRGKVLKEDFRDENLKFPPPVAIV